MRLLGAAGDPDQMMAELGLDRSEDLLDLAGEDDLVELRDHLARAEGAEGTTRLAGGAGRVFGGEVGEVGAALDFGLELVGLGLVGDQNVGSLRRLGLCQV